MRIAHQRARRLRVAKRAMTPDEHRTQDMESLRHYVWRMARRWGAKPVAIAIVTEYRNMGHPKELRRHL